MKITPFFRLTLVTLFSLAISSTSLAKAPSASAVERVKKAGKLRIAVDVTYPPMEMEGDDGKPQGFDVDLARALTNKMGVKAEFVVMNWDGILAGLSSGRYDVIISSMNITTDRLKQVDFVEYVRMSQVFVSPAGKTVSKESELAGKTVAVQADTTSHETVQKYISEKKIPIKEIKAFKGATDAFAALKAGQADVIVIDEPVGLYYAKLDKKSFQVSGRAIEPEPVGIALRKEDADLKALLQKSLDELKKEGSLKNISHNWFGTELGTKN